MDKTEENLEEVLEKEITKKQKIAKLMLYFVIGAVSLLLFCVFILLLLK